MLHLALVAATMPLGLWHWLEGHQGGLLAVLLVPVFVAGGITALFVIALDQADYPVGFLGALRRTGPLVANSAAAFWAGGDVFAAAHWTTSALFAALTLTLFAVVVLAREGEARRLARSIVAPLGVLMGGVTVALAWPVARAVWSSSSPSSSALAALLATVTWLSQVGFTARAWLAMSTFSALRETKEAKAREATFEKRFAGAAALAIFLVLAAETVELFWHLG